MTKKIVTKDFVIVCLSCIPYFTYTLIKAIIGLTIYIILWIIGAIFIYPFVLYLYVKQRIFKKNRANNEKIL